MPQAQYQEKHALTAFIALGANEPADTRLKYLNIRTGLQTLETGQVVIRAISRFYRTPCFPPGAGPDFVNAVAKAETSLSAGQFLDHLHSVERALGRVRAERWGRRTLDLDLLSHDDGIAPDEETFALWRDLPPERQRLCAPDRLILPHPRLQDRAFVLVPWADIAPDWRHPVSGHSVREMLAALAPEDRAGVIPLCPAESG